MSANDVNAALRKHYGTNVEDALSVPTEYPNAKFTRPDDTLWARFHIQRGMSDRVSAGSPGNDRFRNMGSLIVQLFEPLHEGSNETMAKADAIAALFRARTLTEKHDQRCVAHADDHRGWTFPKQMVAGQCGLPVVRGRICIGAKQNE